MKIISHKAPPRFNRKQLVGNLKQAPLLSLLVAFSLFVAFSLALIIYGAYLQKNQTTSNMQQILYNAIQTNFSVFSNYISGLKSTPDRLYLDVKFEDVQLLNYARESAMTRGMITGIEQEVSIKANLSIGAEKYKIKMSPTGQNMDMIGSYDKRAYKVKVLDRKKLYGMREFKLLPPLSRHHIVEWVGHELEGREGLISLRYFFIEVTLNGKDLGVYAVEEHFNKELLENRQAREGIIFSAKNQKIRIFNNNKISASAINRNRIRLLESALQELRNNEIGLSRLFDLKKFATYYAIIDLMFGAHAVGVNTFYYFNPITNLIEPIAREYNSLRYSDGVTENTELMIEEAQKVIKAENGDLDWRSIRNKMFQEEVFSTQYLKNLLRITNSKYLDDFFEDVDEAMILQLNILYRDDPFYKFPKEFIY
jgi:hypothetical protein